MAAPATASGNSSLVGPYGDDSHSGQVGMAFELEPEFRIGGPPASTRRRRIVKAGIIGVLGLGGWAAVAHQETVMHWTKLVSVEIASLLERNASAPVAAVPPLAPLQPLEVANPVSVPEQPVIAPKTEVAVAAETPTPEEETNAAEIERLPPPVIDPADPYQARALAVGLHPGLSRALLSKFSPADFQNAGVAIKTALAETPDKEAFVWPRRRSPELAQFQVKFATSAAPDCRRYVVEIGKDGWMTTALPMEKCGIPKPRQAAVAARKKN